MRRRPLSTLAIVLLVGVSSGPAWAQTFACTFTLMTDTSTSTATLASTRITTTGAQVIADDALITLLSPGTLVEPMAGDRGVDTVPLASGHLVAAVSGNLLGLAEVDHTCEAITTPVSIVELPSLADGDPGDVQQVALAGPESGGGLVWAFVAREGSSVVEAHPLRRDELGGYQIDLESVPVNFPGEVRFLEIIEPQQDAHVLFVSGEPYGSCSQGWVSARRVDLVGGEAMVTVLGESELCACTRDVGASLGSLAAVERDDGSDLWDLASGCVGSSEISQYAVSLSSGHFGPTGTVNTGFDDAYMVEWDPREAICDGRVCRQIWQISPHKVMGLPNLRCILDVWSSPVISERFGDEWVGTEVDGPKQILIFEIDPQVLPLRSLMVLADAQDPSGTCEGRSQHVILLPQDPLKPPNAIGTCRKLPVGAIAGLAGFKVN